MGSDLSNNGEWKGKRAMTQESDFLLYFYFETTFSSSLHFRFVLIKSKHETYWQTSQGNASNVRENQAEVFHFFFSRHRVMTLNLGLSVLKARVVKGVYGLGYFGEADFVGE